MEYYPSDNHWAKEQAQLQDTKCVLLPHMKKTSKETSRLPESGTLRFSVVKFSWDNSDFHFRGYKQPWKIKKCKNLNLMFLRLICKNLAMQKFSSIG